MCPKCVQSLNTFWTHFCYFSISNDVSKMCPQYIQKFGHIMDTFWTHFGRILDPSFFMEKLNKCVQSLDTLWTYFGYILSFGHLMDTFWTHFGFGHILDTLWTRFGHFSRISVQNVSEHTLFTSPPSISSPSTLEESEKGMRKRLSALLRQSCASPQSAKRAARRIASGPDSKLKVGVRESVSPSVRYGPEGVEVRSSLDQRPSKVGQPLLISRCRKGAHEI